MKKARTRAHTRLWAASAIAALCISPLAACGSDGNDTSDTKSDTSSSASTGDAGDAVDKDEFAEDLAAAMVEAKSAHMTMEMSGMKGEGDFRYDGNKSVMEMTMTQGGNEMRMVLADGAMYMQAEGISKPGKWVKIDESTPMLGEMMSQFGNVSPAQQVETMKKGIKTVEYVGEEEIGGDKVKKYDVTVDPRVGLEGTDVPTTGVPESVTYQMYLNEDGLLRRMEMDLQGQSVLMDMTDWGKDVDVQVPPAKDVEPFKMPSMQSQ